MYCNPRNHSPAQQTDGPNFDWWLRHRAWVLLPAIAATQIAILLPSVAIASEKFRQEVFAAEVPETIEQPSELLLSTQPTPGDFPLQTNAYTVESLTVSALPPSETATVALVEIQNGQAADTLRTVLQMSGATTASVEFAASSPECANVLAAGFGCPIFDRYHGDMRIDQILDGRDLGAFSLALSDRYQYYKRSGGFFPEEHGDMDDDGDFDFDDAREFWNVARCVIPEPSSLLLTACCMFMFMGSARRKRTNRCRVAGSRSP
jgi:hypothetical protein